jgi:DNA-directed RNA polymerase subunit N (RpoN/RPB10)
MKELWCGEGARDVEKIIGSGDVENLSNGWLVKSLDGMNIRNQRNDKRDVYEKIPEEAISNLIKTVREGLEIHEPELCEEGINGTYFMKNKQGKRIAVFKPADEEGNTDNNPKRSDENQGEFVNNGILAGEGAQREVAAYLLDHEHFSGVPRTTMVTLSHPSFRSSTESNGEVTKTGSLQEYIDNDGAAWDVGPAVFRVRDVHRIGILDLRIFNNDRHGGNILLNKCPDGAFRLTPIDQGLSLSSTLDHATFEWLNWPQAHIAFDDNTKRYIERINVDEDAQILANLGVRSECIRTMKISTTLLKKGAAAGLTLYEIGCMASRIVFDQPSSLENMYGKASRVAGEDEERLFQVLWKIMDVEVQDKFHSERCQSPRPKELWRGMVASKLAV